MNILGVCGGNGVILHPFKENLVGNIEIRSAFKTPKDIQWQLNFPDKLLFTEDVIKHHKNIDVIVGAPNCGHSSMLALSRGKKFTSAKDDDSFNLFIRSVQELKPKVWMMENLPKLEASYSFDDFTASFPEYTITMIVASVFEFGNSQRTRKRLLVIGCLNPSHINRFRPFPVNIPKLSGDLVWDLKEEDESICNVREGLDERFALYGGKQVTVQEAKEIWEALPENSKRLLTPGENFSTAPGVYRNPRGSYPSTARKQNRQFNHWNLMMTPRELARIQGIPDKFKLWYDETKRKQCITKGRITATKTPPYEIGKWFKICLESISDF